MTKSRHALVLGKKRHLSGWRKDRPDHRDLKMRAGFLQALRLPSTATLRPLCVKTEDQGELGSCTAHSGTSACEFLLKKMGKPVVDLSRLYLYAKTRLYEGTPLSEDSGAEIRNVMKVLAKTGVCAESMWPYNISKFDVPPPPTTDNNAELHKVTYYYRCPSLRTIKASIVQGFPVVGGFSVPENMMSVECSTTGVVRLPRPTEGWEGGHAVLFVGYDDATQLLCFQNSWSTDWGDKGFGYLPYEFVTEGYADDFWTIRAELG